ncbi:MAG TPA: exodeoxyribonuclease VII large subunit, partial [Solirubrobacteraceae bacterium]|nr:exodeoxyribonuclease VII large subunit [Solirubrobacteraceae bacterium]
TLLDDVAAVSCSTPTHAAEAAVPIDCGAARAGLLAFSNRLAVAGNRAVIDRARVLRRLERAPNEHLQRHRTRLHQQLRELRASTRRGIDEHAALTARHALVVARKASAASLQGKRRLGGLRTAAGALRHGAEGASTTRARDLERLRLALAGRDPEATLERGYALVESADGALITSAAAARRARLLKLRFADGSVDADVQDQR